MNTKLLTLILLGFNTLYAQTGEDTLRKSVSLNEAVISANKTEEIKGLLATQITVLNAKQIQFGNFQTTADLISQTGQILVQKSQQGGGSPIIRGFEANRILLVIDGVRMNNLIYRGGHLQNMITIDPSLLDKAEIVYGPASTVYGSDALGGMIHFMTRKPSLSPNNERKISINFLQRYASVNNGFTTHLNFNIGNKRWASLTGITTNRFGDLKMGKNKNPFYDSVFGLNRIYAGRINGKDSALLNKDPYLQKQSGYNQLDILQKFLFQSGQNFAHELNLQYSTSSNLPRYDRLSETRNGKPRFADWYYGPQNRLLASYGINVSNRFAMDKIRLGISYQKVEESRITRNFGSNNRDSRFENVNVLAYHFDFYKNVKNHRLRFGLDGQYNNLRSTAERENISTRIISPLDTRYPDGTNTLRYDAVYYTHNLRFHPKWMLNDGARIGYSKLYSEIKNNIFFNFPVTKTKQSNPIYSGYLGLVYYPVKSLKLSYQISTGYRVPNIDDLAKIFESANGILIIPNPDLEPEQTITHELGITAKPSKNVRIEASLWYTFFRNAIAIRPTQLNGMDSVMYNGVKSSVFSGSNAAQAYILGYSVSVNADLTNYSQVYGNLAYTKGEVTSGNENIPLDHIAPLTGNIGYIYERRKWNAEAYVLFNGSKKLADYSNSGEDNLQYATPDGMPAWITFNAKMGYRWNKNLVLQGGVENLLDTQYRVFASGINAPGRNVFAAVRLKF